MIAPLVFAGHHGTERPTRPGLGTEPSQVDGPLDHLLAFGAGSPLSIAGVLVGTLVGSPAAASINWRRPKLPSNTRMGRAM